MKPAESSTRQILQQIGLIPVLHARSVDEGHALADAMMAVGSDLVTALLSKKASPNPSLIPPAFLEIIRVTRESAA